ncbi:pathogen-associated molecular patterns-induced protein A70-like [Tasmannia lanceolata]|uniref:pathogen-associated molecular patterns-induced protein A70-like n=1 Tax=Tasmannia lanceolata TaxID=3420 RepID=UPI004063BB4D
MLEKIFPSIWFSMYSFFNPTVLFILINIVIGTLIAFSSKKQENPENKSQLTRAGSVLERLKSFNLYRQKTEEIPPITTLLENPSTHQTVENLQSLENSETLVEEADPHFGRSVSDTHPTAGERPVKLREKMKKSASAKSVFGHFEREEIVERPKTTRERKTFGDDEEVDAKADDFINRFKQHLKLQRLDSIIRYKEMLNRGK